MPSYQIRLLEKASEMRATEKLTDEIWRGGELDIVPSHMITAIIHNGGFAFGAFENEQMVGYIFGFPGFSSSKNLQLKHCSHQMGVHPNHRGKNIGFALKKAQRQMVRQQGLDLITWTYDPLLSRNAYLNIARLGAICNTYKRNEYGDMIDGLNAGITSDRFQVDWWVNTKHVSQHLDAENQPNYQETDSQTLYTPERNAGLGLLIPPKHHSPPSKKRLLLEIPSNYQSIREKNISLAQDWRFFTREIFEEVFNAGYIVTDFIYERSGITPRSFYVLSTA